MYDLTNALGYVGAAVVFVGGVMTTVKKYWPKVQKGFETVEKIWEHLQKNTPAQQAVADVEVAATVDDKALREVSLKAAIHEIGQALKVETDNLVDASPVISRYLRDRFPAQFQNLTTEEVASAIKAAQSCVEDLRGQDTAKLIQDVIRYANGAQTQVAHVSGPSTQPTATVQQSTETAN